MESDTDSVDTDSELILVLGLLSMVVASAACVASMAIMNRRAINNEAYASRAPMYSPNAVLPVSNKQQDAPPNVIRARALSPVPESQKAKLNAIDKGRCLLTFEKSPAYTEPCHIVGHRIANDKIKYYQRVWGLAEFNIDTPQNLVSLRSDWRAAYNQGSWAFVPVQSTLEKIKAYASTASFEKPYSGFRKNTEYVFVALPGLNLKTIQRVRYRYRVTDAYQSSDNFSGLPTFKHHAHPYFAILNALPKLKAHANSLTPPQRSLLQAMENIHDQWLSTQPGVGHKRRRDNTEDGPQDETGHKDKKTNQMSNEKVLQPARTNIETRVQYADKVPTQNNALATLRPTQNNAIATLQPSHPPPVLPNGIMLHYDQRERILAWANGVAAALPQTARTVH